MKWKKVQNWLYASEHNGSINASLISFLATALFWQKKKKLSKLVEVEMPIANTLMADAIVGNFHFLEYSSLLP